MLIEAKTMDFTVVLENPFPPYHTVLDQIKPILLNEKILGVLYIDCGELRWIEQFYGRHMHANVINTLINATRKLAGTMIRHEDIITSNYPNQDQFFIFLSPKRADRKFYSTDLEEMALRVKKHLNAAIKNEVSGAVAGRTFVQVGFATVLYNSMVDLERQIETLIEDSRKVAEFMKFLTKMRYKEKVKELILKEAINTVYQPIVELEKFSVIGFEALTRGPKGTVFEHPDMLFEIARELEMGFELDSLCRNSSFTHAKEMDKNHRIFVNFQPGSIADPEFKGKFLRKFLQELNLAPENIVFEINEREAITNWEIFEKSLGYYLSHGFSFALDDAGAGYSSFETIHKLKPHYIKIDMGIIRNVQNDLVKQQIVKSLVAISSAIRGVIIAEGIQTIEECRTLMELGVTHGQGFLFAKPDEGFPAVDSEKLLALLKKEN